MGRPKKFDDVKNIQQHIDEYFNVCKKNKTPTIEGLAAWLGIDRHTLLTYEKAEGYEEFHATIKKAKDFILAVFIDDLLDGDKKIPPAIGIFLLKNNYGYRDQQEVKVTDSFEVEF